MYLCKDVPFTGDSLLRKGDGVGVPPSLFSENSAQNRESVRALLSLTFDTIADGHVGATRGAKAKLSRLRAGS